MKLYFNLGRMILSKYHIYTAEQSVGYEDVRHELLQIYNDKNLPRWPSMSTAEVRSLIQGIKKL